LPAILDLQAQLKKKEIHLILVPVPGKVVIYPDKLQAGLGGPRLDELHSTFYELLRKEEITVLDLTPILMELRKAGTDTHCRQDSHWTPAVVKRTAKEIAGQIQKQLWYKDVLKANVQILPKPIETQGDLVTLLDQSKVAKEKLTIEQVALNGQPVTGDRQSPVVLLGDSHTIVYHEPINSGIQVRNSGLLDHLAAELGFAPDMTGVLGSGANASRIALARRKDNLAGKKCLIWCFAAREFTETSQGWLKIPLLRE
jgi:alginate O-acetyltransferase complex protein AlgJ